MNPMTTDLREAIALAVREVLDGVIIRSAGPSDFVVRATNLDLKIADAVLALLPSEGDRVEPSPNPSDASALLQLRGAG